MRFSEGTINIGGRIYQASAALGGLSQSAMSAAEETKRLAIAIGRARLRRLGRGRLRKLDKFINWIVERERFLGMDILLCASLGWEEPLGAADEREALDETLTTLRRMGYLPAGRA